MSRVCGFLAMSKVLSNHADKKNQKVSKTGMNHEAHEGHEDGHIIFQ